MKSLAMVVVFLAAIAVAQESVVHTFTGLDGAFPYGTLLLYPGDGHPMYGTTSAGGAYNQGVIFSLPFNDVWDFGSYAYDGATPMAPLILGFHGQTLIGTTAYGGTDGQGTTFQYTFSDTFENVLHNFSAGNPTGSFVKTAYGVTPNGGTYGKGTVFVNTEDDVIYNFTGGLDGGEPQAGLFVDSTDTMYGTTMLGGTYGKGTIFKMTLAAGVATYTVLHSFGGAGDGAYPYSALVSGKGGLWGTTAQGGEYGVGTVYKIAKKTGVETVIYSFGAYADDGLTPYSGVFFDLAGNAYGTTYSGGQFGYGTVYELKPNGKVYTESKLYDFTGGPDGANPYAGLIRGFGVPNGGYLFGSTINGGDSVCKCGVVFEIPVP